jgi:hypothetical protein
MEFPACRRHEDCIEASTGAAYAASRKRAQRHRKELDSMTSMEKSMRRKILVAAIAPGVIAAMLLSGCDRARGAQPPLNNPPHAELHKKKEAEKFEIRPAVFFYRGRHETNHPLENPPIDGQIDVTS